MAITAHYLHVGRRTVHYRRRGDGPPVVLLHASPRSSASLEPQMLSAPDGLSILAIDTPGFGYSDPLPPHAATIEDFADALADTLTALGIGRTRLYGTHTGADIALVFAVRHPARVVQLVLDGLSCFDADERVDLLDHYLPPFIAKSDGTHMAWLWSRLRDQALFFPWHRQTMATRLHRAIPRAAQLQRAAIDWLIASDTRSAYVASIETDAAAWVARLVVPALIGAREGDVLSPHLARLTDVPAGVAIETFPGASDAWTKRIWSALSIIEPEAAAVVPQDTPIGTDTALGAAGRRVRWRGRRSGATRPLVWLHASPGSGGTIDSSTIQERPCLALDLPGHGESDAPPDAACETMLQVVDEALMAIGLAEADLAGQGSGAALARSLATRWPKRWRAAGTASPRGSEAAPRFADPREDGGHLLAAWQRARDEQILGPWWSRDPDDRHDFGDVLDWSAIHRSAVAQLLETPIAAEWRSRIAAGED